jgi:hypothetical protein
MFFPPWRAPHALSHLGPSKEIYQRSLKNPSRPKPDYHLVRLGTNPIGSAAYLPLPLPPVYLPFISRAKPLLDCLQQSPELARKNSWVKAGQELSQDPLLGLGALWA